MRENSFVSLVVRSYIVYTVESKLKRSQDHLKLYMGMQ